MVDVFDSIWKIRVVQELQRWSGTALNTPSAFFGGIPACPYAKQAWAASKVQVDFGDESAVMDAVRGWDGLRDVIIVVAQDWPHDQIEEWCEKANQEIAKFDLTLMAFVPGSGPDTGQPTEEMEDWVPLVDEEYAMVFIQVLSDLNAASESLEASGYYENCTPEFRKYVFDRRKGTDHARQEEVNEEARQENASVHAGEDRRQEEEG
jgi:hypothetical protein